MAVCAERRRSGKLNGRGRSPECSKDMNKPSAKANFICILLKRVLSSTKIAKAESNYENLFLKIAEPHPVFYKDSQSRENTKIYFRHPGRPDYSDGCEMFVNSMRIGRILRHISGFFTIFVSRNDEGVPFVPFVRFGIVGALPVLWKFPGFWLVEVSVFGLRRKIFGTMRVLSVGYPCVRNGPRSNGGKVPDRGGFRISGVILI